MPSARRGLGPEALVAEPVATTRARPVSRLQRERSRNREAREIMGAGTPVVLRSDPRPRPAEEAILLIGEDNEN